MSEHENNHNHVHGDHSGHDHSEDEEIVVAFSDEDGNEKEMVLVQTFDVGEDVYALLLERSNPEADGFILRLEEEDGETVLVNIEEEAEWAKVEAAYNELIAAQSEQE